MEEFRKILITLSILLISLVILIFTGVFLVNRFTKDSTPKTETVTSRTIIEKIKDQYFVVTKTIYIDQNTEIVVDEGSTWSNLFWGQNIEANSLVRIDIGVDLQQIEEGNVEVNEETKTVKIVIPDAEILDASVSGEIELKSTKGILRRLFNNDTTGDYNRSVEKLVQEAKISVLEDEKLFTDAKSDSIQLLEVIIGNLGYKLEIVEQIDPK